MAERVMAGLGPLTWDDRNEWYASAPVLFGAHRGVPGSQVPRLDALSRRVVLVSSGLY
jgi:hypothetical protein